MWEFNIPFGYASKIENNSRGILNFGMKDEMPIFFFFTMSKFFSSTFLSGMYERENKNFPSLKNNLLNIKITIRQKIWAMINYELKMTQNRGIRTIVSLCWSKKP